MVTEKTVIPPENRTPAKPLLVAAVLIITLAVAYSPLISAGFLSFDDDVYVYENPTMKDLEGLRRLWLEPGSSPQYYPMVFTSFWLEQRLWGQNPLGYHVVNVALHAGNAVLLFFLLDLLAVPGAFLAALLFALHPIQVESVAWIAERKNVLSGLFTLMAAFTYLRYAGFEVPKEKSRRGSWYAVSLLCFIAALLSKSVTATLPFALAVIMWANRGKTAAGNLPSLLPFLALGTAAGIHTAGLERIHVGAIGQAWDFSFFERLLIAGRSLWFYLGKLAVPSGISFIYPRWTIDGRDPLQYLFPAGFLFLAVFLFMVRRRVGRWPVAALFLYGITLGPVLGFVNFYPMIFSYVANHFAYLAAIVPLACVAASASSFACRRKVPAVLLKVLGGTVLLGLGFLTWTQAHTYKDTETLWKATLQVNPDAWLAHNNLGVTLLNEGMTEKAEYHFLEILRVDEENPSGWYNLGETRRMGGDFEGAVRCYRKAAELQPAFAEAYHRLATSLMELGSFLEAEPHLRQAVALNQSSPLFHFDYGTLNLRLGDFSSALAEFEQVLRLDPAMAEAHYNIGIILVERGRPAEAVDHYRKAVRLNPRNPIFLNNLGAILSELGRWDEAEVYLREAARLKPDDATIHGNLDALASQRKAKTPSQAGSAP